MRILSCRSDDAFAHEAYQLRYEVFIDELGYEDGSADHVQRSLTDELDRFSRIYVALDDDERVIATARTLYFRDLDSRKLIPDSLLAGYEIERYEPHFSDAMALATKFVVAKDHRGTLAATLITSHMFADCYRDNILFILSSCGPSLVDLYHHLGFRFYAPPSVDANGLYFPIVFAVRDSDYLDLIRSPFRKIIRQQVRQPDWDPSIVWFYKTFESQLGDYVKSVDNYTVETMIKQSERLTSEGRHTFFSNIEDHNVRRLATACLSMRILKGQILIEGGQKDNDLYLVIEGGVDVSYSTGSEPMQVTEGEMIGAIDYFSGRRIIHCTAATDCTLLIVPQLLLHQLSKRDPALANAINVNIGRSLAAQFERLIVAA